CRHARLILRRCHLGLVDPEAWQGDAVNWLAVAAQIPRTHHERSRGDTNERGAARRAQRELIGAGAPGSSRAGLGPRTAGTTTPLRAVGTRASFVDASVTILVLAACVAQLRARGCTTRARRPFAC